MARGPLSCTSCFERRSPEVFTKAMEQVENFEENFDGESSSVHELTSAKIYHHKLFSELSMVEAKTHYDKKLSK